MNLGFTDQLTCDAIPDFIGLCMEKNLVPQKAFLINGQFYTWDTVLLLFWANH